MTNAQSGNILVYILGAIFLMGILLVVMRGSNQQGSNIDEEQLMIRVSEVQRYGAELENAVRLIMNNGFSEADIRFAHPNAPSGYGLITDNPGRQVFSSQGGAAKFRPPPSGIQITAAPWVFNGSNVVGGVGSSLTSPASADLIAFLPNVTRSFCLKINDALNIPEISGEPPSDDGIVNTTSIFTGTFSDSAWISSVHLNALNPHIEACFENSGLYHYYRVLLAR